VKNSALLAWLKLSACERGCGIRIIWPNNNIQKPKSDRREEGGRRAKKFK
jgi:hypothetical protein